MLIYADNAATTKLSARALDAMLPYLTEQYGNPSSIHPLGQKASRALVLARETAARALGAQPSEITFTSGGSESDNQALLTAASVGKKKGKKHLIASAIEHPAILRTLEALQENGFEITLLPVTKEGFVLPETVADAIRDDTICVSVMMANNETGTIQDIASIGRICHEKGVLFHTDAVQAVGHIPVNLKELPVDLLSLSGHKFHGPKGIGILFARSGLELVSLIHGGEQERGKRAGTENLPAIVGLAAALEEACTTMAQKTDHVRPLRNALRDALLKLPDTHLNGDPERCLPGHLNITFEGIPSEVLLPILGANGICASAGSACAAGAATPSHVLLALGLSPKDARSSIRFSLGDDITEEEVQCMIETITKHVTRLRKG
jgi:cysteine desulfurase